MIMRTTLPLLPLLGLSAYFVTSIFYVFPSGTPQPADFLLVITVAGTALFGWRHLPADPRLSFAAALFAGWITLINVIWFFIVPDFAFLQKTLFYLFNITAFLFTIAVANHDFDRLRLVIWWSCVCVLFIQLIYVEFVGLNEGKRAIGTFNNPNQLGYWAILVMACLAVTKERARLHFLDVLALAAGLYIVILTLSRAALGASLVLLFLTVVVCKLDRKTTLLAMSLLVFGVALEIGQVSQISNVGQTTPVSNLLDRFEEGVENRETVWKRGYQRLFDHPEYIVFGAGEGNFGRFSPEDDPRELHSSLANLLLSYGIIGLVLFGLLMYFALASAPWPSVAYFCAIMLYGMTHMGLRFSLFWIFLGLIYAQTRHYARRRHGRRRTFGSGLRGRQATVASLRRRSVRSGAASRPTLGADEMG